MCLAAEKIGMEGLKLMFFLMFCEMGLLKLLVIWKINIGNKGFKLMIFNDDQGSVWIKDFKISSFVAYSALTQLEQDWSIPNKSFWCMIFWIQDLIHLSEYGFGDI